MATSVIDGRLNGRTVGPVPNAGADVSPLLAILPAVILLYAAILPSEMRVTIAGLAFYPPRIAGLIIFPMLVWRVRSSAVRWGLWDMVFAIGAFWMTFAFMVVYGPVDGGLRGAALTIDIVFPYLVGRLCFRDLADLRRFLILAAPGLALAASTLILEVVLARPVIRPLAASLFSPLPVYENGVAVGLRGSVFEQRLGIIRATGPFSHPIHAGLFLASFLPLYLYSGLRGWPKLSGLAASCLAVLSASSAAFLAIMVALGLLVVDWIQKITAFVTWRIVIVPGLLLLGLMQILSDNGLAAFGARFTLNPGTAHFRRLIWQFGSESVANNPWFGIGFEAYERPDWMRTDSVDNHWLLLAMRFGLLPAVAMFAVMVAGIVLLSMAANRQIETDRKLLVALAISLFTMGVVGFSVAFFGGIQSWFYLLVATAISIATGPSNILIGRSATAPLAERDYRDREPMPVRL